MRSGKWLALFALPALAACSAAPDEPPRALSVVEPPAASGAGEAAACGALAPAGPALSLAQPGTDLLDPQWVLGAKDAPVYLYTSSATPAGSRVLQRVALDPWSAQPPAFSEPALALDAKHKTIPGDAFAVAQLYPLDDDDNFESVVVYRERYTTLFPDPLPPGSFFRTARAWSEGSEPFSSWSQHIGQHYGERIVSFRSSGAEQLAITEVYEPGPRYAMMVGTVWNGVGSSKTGMYGGCATTPIAFDAAWWKRVDEEDTGWVLRYWLFGAALGAPTDWQPGWFPCDVKYPGVGPATTIYLGRYSVDGISIASSGSAMSSNEAIHEAAPVARLRMAPRPDGAWLAWTLAPLEGAPGALRVARMTPSGGIALPPITVPSCSTPVAESLAAEQVDGDLVVAVVETNTRGKDRIVLRRLDADGRLTWMSTLFPGGKVEGSLSMLAQRDRGLLIAWAERPSSSSASQLRAVRLGCAEGSSAAGTPVCETEEVIPQ
ncbi:hypothetical protein [Sorangium atrum]|uniref:Secreted protein n=1 Tax=Sorangium atrum TaxID=2995308 RepID=A0ABT5BYL5_9BACT|nr:hypothetical protein [Sorangium aterium]MDC0679182.1 hypothetical protein [Sorangium aterium]